MPPHAHDINRRRISMEPIENAYSIQGGKRGVVRSIVKKAQVFVAVSWKRTESAQKVKHSRPIGRIRKEKNLNNDPPLNILLIVHLQVFWSACVQYYCKSLRSSKESYMGLLKKTFKWSPRHNVAIQSIELV